MPYTPTARILVLCDALATALQTAWAPTGNDGVERAYFKRIADAEGAEFKLLGRRVVIYPTDYGNDPASRGEDEYTHNVTVDVFERYTSTSGDPTVEWIDARVDFVSTYVVDGFDFSYDGGPSWNRKLITRSADVSVCDAAKLVGGNRLFFSRVELVFSETADS